jgi:hypothetical protein
VFTSTVAGVTGFCISCIYKYLSTSAHHIFASESNNSKSTGVTESAVL